MKTIRQRLREFLSTVFTITTMIGIYIVGPPALFLWATGGVDSNFVVAGQEYGVLLAGLSAIWMLLSLFIVLPIFMWLWWIWEGTADKPNSLNDND